MIRACEEIAARRRAAGGPGERLRAVEFALERWRGGVVAGGDPFAGPSPDHRGAAPEDAAPEVAAKAALAGETGAFAALEAIGAGY